MIYVLEKDSYTHKAEVDYFHEALLQKGIHSKDKVVKISMNSLRGLKDEIANPQMACPMGSPLFITRFFKMFGISIPKKSLFQEKSRCHHPRLRTLKREHLKDYLDEAKSVIIQPNCFSIDEYYLQTNLQKAEFLSSIPETEHFYAVDNIHINAITDVVFRKNILIGYRSETIDFSDYFWSPSGKEIQELFDEYKKDIPEIENEMFYSFRILTMTDIINNKKNNVYYDHIWKRYSNLELPIVFNLETYLYNWTMLVHNILCSHGKGWIKR